MRDRATVSPKVLPLSLTSSLPFSLSGNATRASTVGKAHAQWLRALSGHVSLRKSSCELPSFSVHPHWINYLQECPTDSLAKLSLRYANGLPVSEIIRDANRHA
ncbi:hypothetical protein RRG08_038044 [Elysia crispata]|uniref:Uncharacterized protein n=1 Tax=Elysia crispata TaxID=231223 RepID=A0AAE1DP70_9GAST|nr:hypothetical protein RRG08_038044 [Elysia crispata]